VGKLPGALRQMRRIGVKYCNKIPQRINEGN